MSATPRSTGTSSLASSAAFRRFAIVCALTMPVLYVICGMADWVLFTYYPATGRIDLGWAPAIRGEGPAMYWYGRTGTTLLGVGALGLLASALPERVVGKIPLSLVWILPLVAIPILVYELRWFWRF